MSAEGGENDRVSLKLAQKESESEEDIREKGTRDIKKSPKLSNSPAIRVVSRKQKQKIDVSKKSRKASKKYQ